MTEIRTYGLAAFTSQITSLSGGGEEERVKSQVELDLGLWDISSGQAEGKSTQTSCVCCAASKPGAVSLSILWNAYISSYMN